ncbi:hypothetical protein FEM48_Zijuj01G0292900 [Ziziphus jujuba var. spinosa]|uniref:non-specific serine/threonine protein kinase n=1 Tax=Ziziphus jujuba var. spinosa TaxID=714518 RepID=A0A978W5P5_ZIZJJ|nr:hypothetical protein FEM48_Zijuj01G0292900 [Ziziphus jujuba var. spinosa]
MSLQAPPPRMLPPPIPPGGGMPTGTMVAMILGIVIGGFSMLVAVGIFVIFYRRWKRKKMLELGLQDHKPGGDPSRDTKSEKEHNVFLSISLQLEGIYERNNNIAGKGRPTMNWPTRMKIALGSARGLAYLHEDCQPKIIHRDIKAANILLEDDFVPKVADFGLARFSSDSDTHVSTRVMGTFGYLAPEYASSGKLTDRSDVFSFGVVLLELITGRRPISKAEPFADDSMVEWARPLLVQALENDDFNALVDPRLQNDYDSTEMTRMVACAAACVRQSARLRPPMSQTVRALEGNIALNDLSEGVTPGSSIVLDSYGSTSYNASQYKEDLKKFQKLALQVSQERTFSEGSGLSSDFGQHPSTSSSGQHTTQEIELEKIKKDTQDFQ